MPKGDFAKQVRSDIIRYNIENRPPASGKNGVGRPKEIIWPKVLELLNKYIENTKVPILKEFTSNWGLLAEDLEHRQEPEFRQALKRLRQKKEAMLEQGMLYGKLSQVGSIFSLKQLGWRDTHEIKSTVEITEHEKESVDDIFSKIQQRYN